MKRFLSSVFICLWVANAYPQSKAILDHPEVVGTFKLIDAWVEAQMDYRKTPGMSIGILYDQDLIYAKGFGFADVEKKVPVTPQTIFRIASVTKTFTATAIMQLRDQGRLQLDDPIDKYLPWFRIKNKYPEAPRITIRQLITHTSGLPREAAFPYWTDNKFPTRTEMIQALETQETIFPSETRLKYSNLALTLAGEIIVAITGVSYDEFIKKNILDPLGMTSTTVYFPDVQKSRLAVGYSRRLSSGKRNVMPFTNAKGLTPSANMSSTLEDLSRFVSLQFKDGPALGSQILKGSTLREMQRVHWLQPNWQSGWGLGFGVWRQDDKTVVGHGGWVGGYRTQLSFVPAEKIAVIIMTNADDGDPGYFAEKLITMISPVMKKVAGPPIEVTIADPSWKMYVGKYQDAWWFDTEVFIINGKLVTYDYGYPPENNPRNNVVELKPEGTHTFRMTGENANGELVVFELDADKKVTRVKVGENYLYPKKDERP